MAMVNGGYLKYTDKEILQNSSSLTLPKKKLFAMAILKIQVSDPGPSCERTS